MPHMRIYLDASNEGWKVWQAHTEEIIEVVQQLLDNDVFLRRVFRFFYLKKNSTKQTAEKLLGKCWIFL